MIIGKLTKRVAINDLESKMQQDEELEGEKKEDQDKKDLPTNNVEQVLKSIGLSECIAKLKEEKLEKPELFFDLDDDPLIGFLGIETEGKKFRFKEKMKEIRDAHAKEAA